MTDYVSATALAAELGISVPDLLKRADAIVQAADDPRGLSTAVRQRKNHAEVHVTADLAARLREQ